MTKHLKGIHIEVLKILHKLYLKNPDYVWTFLRIQEETNNTLLKAEVRRIVRLLKRKGYAKYHIAFSEDENLVSGSGHLISGSGIQYLIDVG